MKCLIIAAGRGSRLSPRGDSKPLIPLLGLPLIERAILTAKDAGLTDFSVVTGHNGDKQCVAEASEEACKQLTRIEGENIT